MGYGLICDPIVILYMYLSYFLFLHMHNQYVGTMKSKCATKLSKTKDTMCG